MISYLSQEISDNADIYWFESSNKYVIVDKSFSEILSIKLGEKDDINSRKYFPQYFLQPLKLSNYIKILIIFVIRSILVI